MTNIDADERTASMKSSSELSEILKRIIEENSQNGDQLIKNFIQKETIDGIKILKYLGNFIKITTSNYSILLQNSEFFSELHQALIFYEKVIENVEIDQQNFINLLILDHLLINVTESNASLFSIYANLFLVDIDVQSFYQFVIKHCFGRPNSIYVLSLFVKECNDIKDNRSILRNVYLESRFDLQNFQKWAFGVFGYFSYRFELLEKCDLIDYYDFYVIHKLNDSVFMNDKYIQNIKKPEKFSILLKCFLNDDVDLFGQFVSQNHIDINGTFRKPKDSTKFKMYGVHHHIASINDTIYWPFDQNEYVSYIELAAFLKSLKILKYLILNHADFNEDLIDMAIAGGNLEIVHTCLQKNCPITSNSIKMSIKYYHIDIFTWIIENNSDLVQNSLKEIAFNIITYSNPQAYLVMHQCSYDLNDILIDTFYSIEHEWIKFFINYNLMDKYLNFENSTCIQTIFEYKNFKNFKYLLNEYKFDLNFETIKNDIDFDSYFQHESFCSIQYYLQKNGEIDKYKDQLILPPIPNKFIVKFLKLKFNSYGFFISYNHYDDLLVFLINRNAIHIKGLNLAKICEFLISINLIELLESIQKFQPLVSDIAFSKIFNKDWYYFLFNDERIKAFFFKYCLIDKESYLDFQTEGLHYACFFGDATTVEYLLKRKYIDVNSKKFDNGRTPLNLASECNFVDIVYLLINDKRVDINSFSNDKETSIYSACEYNYIEIVELLLKCEKIDINIANKDGKTPFFIACENGNYKVVKRLLARCDLNLNTMVKNESAFGVAVEKWQLKVVQLLINENRINFQFENEENPLQKACSKGNLQMVEILFSNESINKNELDNKGILFEKIFIEIFYISLV